MEQGLNIEQHMQTVQRLSPRQVQFVRLLEMNGPEIEEEVRRQIDDNPALEVADHDDARGDEAAPESEVMEDPLDKDPDDDPADYFAGRQDAGDTYYTPQAAEDGDDLYTYLTAQLGEIETSPLTRRIAAYIIGNIDENGYLTRSRTAMAEDIEIATGIEIAPEQMDEAFRLVRALDPAGVGAVDLRDCLILQLNRMRPDTPMLQAAREIVTDYFDLLSKKHLDRLQAQLGISDKDEMKQAMALIRSLNPKPGSSIAASRTSQRLSQITPDVLVEQADNGRFTVSLISNIPRLQIEKSFAADMTPAEGGGAAGRDARRKAQAFIKLKRDDAEAFISALQQRSNTLLSVTEAIVRLQPEFFATGETSQLRPMILKDVASLTGLDISVISRATASKYVATGNGTYPLKMFFNEAPKENSDTSSHLLLHKIQELIDNEDKRHPLSDEAIRGALAAQGHDVARRTVTKYREKLGLPIGRLRKNI